jgi:pectinesterase
MDYHKVIFVRRRRLQREVIIPSWLTHIEICGEDRDNTIITYDDHANIKRTDNGKPMGTFRTYTLKIEGSDITLKNITIENNAARLGKPWPCTPKATGWCLSTVASWATKTPYTRA